MEAETLEDISIFLCLSIYAVTSFFVKIHVLKLRLSKSTRTQKAGVLQKLVLANQTRGGTTWLRFFKMARASRITITMMYCTGIVF